QKWLSTRLENKDDAESLIYTDLLRLNYIKANLNSNNKDVLWESALLNLHEKHYKTSELAMIDYELAKYYNQLGGKYNFLDSTTIKYQTYKKKAHSLLSKVIELYPKATYYPECKNLINEIEKTSFTYQSEKIVKPNSKFPIRIDYVNTDKLYITVLKCDYAKYLKKDKSYYEEGYYSEILKMSETIIKSKLIELPKSSDYNTHNTEYLCDALDKGFYIIFLHAKPEFQIEENYISESKLFVSDLSLTTNNSYYKNSGYYVFDRTTGQPIVGAKIETFKYEYSYIKREYVYNKLATEYTDESGFASMKKFDENTYSDIRLDISKNDDFISENTYLYYYDNYEEQRATEIKIFTDRAIYRPGQTINFKAICIDKKSEEIKILPNFTTTVFLYDVNYQEIASKHLTTNEYGSFNGSFTIPLDVLTGNFHISAGEFSHYIKVEEYKRPMFEVKMLPIEGEYRINDSIHAEGTAMTYAGTALTDAKVSYKIVRNPMWWGYYSGGSFTQKEIAYGDVKVDDDGKFKIGFKAIADDFGEMNKNIYYYYTISVSTTDINGETQASSSIVYVAEKSLILSNDFYGNLEKSKIDSISVNSNNISGVFVPANVKVEIFKLNDPGLLLAKRQWGIVDKPLYSEQEWHSMYPGYEFSHETEYSNWTKGENVFSHELITKKGSKLALKNASQWQSGVYRIVMTSKDKWGNDIENTNDFVLYDKESTKMPYTATSFFIADNYSAQPGETVNLIVGSSYENVYLLYELEVKGKSYKKEIIKLDAETKKIPIKIEENYRGGISINLMFIKDSRLYSSNQRIEVPWKNKDLDLKFITFRDKTLPGSKEEWKIKITDQNGTISGAELLASMYDASLDKFAQNSWYWAIFPNYYSYSNWSGNSFTYGSSSVYFINFYPDNVPKLIYNPGFNFYGFSYDGRYYDNDRSGRTRTAAAESAGGLLRKETISFSSTAKDEEAELEDGIMLKKDQTAQNSITLEEQTLENAPANRQEKAGESDKRNQYAEVQIRKNFNETAFFYPNLVTDKNGEILISFTMPESLTRWNFMGFAHTKDLKLGQISKEVITQKELMVMPNLPRFFRENDKMTISVKINNVSDMLIVGKSNIEFFDPITLKNLNDLFLLEKSEIKKISIEKDKNIAVNWDIKIPEGLSAVGVRITAESKHHSDGEERIIPILTNRMLVTETMPLPVRKAGTTEFVMKKLKTNNSSTLKHHRYTLEFTNNPAWYAVQALPYIMEYPFDCAEQTFSRYYANILATHIANSDPKIKRVFDIWKNTPSSQALMSNLEKNQELKALLLEETPWVLEAKDENERKHRIGLLFDLNRMSMESNSALTKLQKQQKYNGGWAWFDGMPESWYITQHIVTGMGHLDNLGVTYVKSDSKTWNMTKKAIEFIDGELVDSYNHLKRYCDEDCMEKDNISYMQIQYLYARSYFINDVPINKRTEEAFNYYKGQAEKYWKNKSFYMQGMIALALNRYDKKTVPVKIVASLKEHAIHSDEMGMYWKNDRGYYWYQAPIETHALLIEMFDEVANDETSVEEIKVWLLKQKQTQDWKTTKATAEAIYALLLRGTNLLSDDSMAVIEVGNMKIDPANDPEIKTEAGTGYFKKAWDGSMVKPEWGDVKVTKTNSTVSWGAVYWQYFEQLDKITEFEETPLTINKKLFVQRREGNKPVIVPIKKDANLEVGDKVTVRIEIRVDRDMEYVHLKDMRASCFEPVDYISGYRYKAGLGYYQGIKDASMNFFIDYLRKGTYVFEYDLIVSQKGDFSNGITTIQSMYAPEFTSHSEGVRVLVK
ncbi:MAG: alpha-2-macroglobulin family protein, partial [Bacteroidales bacterium]|nr:alpha-2-macroglobulin family protein [Bacteroidales bacterium]